MKPYFIEFWTGRIRFDDGAHRSERIRKPRLRAQRLYIRFGGKPFLPLSIVHYQIPAFYYADFMHHRRKLGLDWGLSKLRHGRDRAKRITELKGE